MPPPQSALVSALQTVIPALMALGSMGFVFFFPAPVEFKIVMGLVAVLSAFGMVALKMVTSRAGKKQRRRDGMRYGAYIADQEALLQAHADEQHAAETYRSPQLHTLWRNGVDTLRLWERRRSDPDFLRIRVGVGRQPLAFPVQLQDNPSPFVDYVPELRAMADHLLDRFSHLDGAPVNIPLLDLGALSVVGERGTTRATLRGMLMQLVTLHSPDDVAIIVAHDYADTAEWRWVGWLPHARRGGRRFDPATSTPFIASNSTVLNGLLKAELDQRTAASVMNGTDTVRHLVIVVDRFTPEKSLAALATFREFLSRGRELHATVICLADRHSLEPSNVDARLELSSPDSMVYERTEGVGAVRLDVYADAYDVAFIDRIAQMLSPFRLDERRAAHEVHRDTVRLLDLLAIPSATKVVPRTTWRRGSPDDVLRVPIGLGVDGEPVLLDLKEAAVGGMGPHGLIVGATGSGKSELLRSLVTGLSIRHAPDLLNFVFADFKGGAAFADLSTIPHVAGMITNLQNDLPRVDRMFAALVGEMARRQKLLRDAGNVDGIKEYQTMYVRDPSIPPMPYLLVVVDEFGELLTVRPDFLDLFTAIGRVGRSLGMHLLFATQRLDEGRISGLEGHLRYRICLRTFSAEESRAVLGSGDAYQLPSLPGAGYFKVDTTIYRRFQAALITTPVPVIPPEVAATDDPTQAPPAPAFATELEVVVQRLAAVASARRIVHQVWLPPLPVAIPLDDVIRRTAASLDAEATNQSQPFGTLRAPLALLDLPEAQTQVPLVLDFAGVAGHLAVAGAPQSGKSTLLRTLIASYALTHSPEDAQFYILDFGGGSLHALDALAHVGAVCGRLDKELVRRTIREMRAILEERQLLFRRHNVDSIATFRESRQQFPRGSAADVFLVIDNWGQFRVDLEDVDDDIGELLSNGLGYGIHVIIATNRWADIRSQLRDNIGQRMELRLNDPLDSEMVRGAAKTLANVSPGRGITQAGQHFQVALTRADGAISTGDLQSALAELISHVDRRWDGHTAARPIRMLPSNVALAELSAPTAAQRGVPLGIEELRLEPLYLDILGSDPHFIALGDSEAGKTTLLRAWMHQLSRYSSPESVQFAVVDYRHTLIDAAVGPHVWRYAATPNLTNDMVADLRVILTDRLPGADVTREQLISRTWWTGPEYVLIVDDYDLVVGAMGSPLQPLVDLLAHGRDVGFHLLLARRVGGVSRSSFEPVYQRLRELAAPGLILSGDPQEGYLLGPHRATNQPPGRGLLVQRGQRSLLVQIANTEPAA
jgi:S-DNA-T family DNA segregation ATPase FtsK/SpoIIIE